MEMKKRIAILAILFIAISFQANAELFNRGTDSLGNRLIYDSDLNITWYDYTHWGNGGWGQSGTWQYHTDWASTLSVNFNGEVYDDWRLPLTFDDSCMTYNCINSELGNLFYIELGNKAYPNQGFGLSNTGDFQQLYEGPYWSATEYSSNVDQVWYFDTYWGDQHVNFKNGGMYAIAVRSGDVTVVPEPISSTLFLIGAGVLAGRRYFRKKK